MILVGLFVAGIDRQAKQPEMAFLNPHRVTTATMTTDLLAAGRRINNPESKTFSRTAQFPRKGSLTMSQIPLTLKSGAGKSASTVSNEDASELPRPGNYSPLTEDEGNVTVPMLRVDRKSGRLELANPRPLSLVGGMNTCLEVGYSMLRKAQSSDDLLMVLTASAQITIAKICASNGSVVISCRNNQITVSPRPARPNDNCVRSG